MAADGSGRSDDGIRGWCCVRSQSGYARVQNSAASPHYYLSARVSGIWWTTERRTRTRAGLDLGEWTSGVLEGPVVVVVVCTVSRLREWQ